MQTFSIRWSSHLKCICICTMNEPLLACALYVCENGGFVSVKREKNSLFRMWNNENSNNNNHQHISLNGIILYRICMYTSTYNVQRTIATPLAGWLAEAVSYLVFFSHSHYPSNSILFYSVHSSVHAQLKRWKNYLHEVESGKNINFFLSLTFFAV